MSAIYKLVQNIKELERHALREALRKHGQQVDGGDEHHFEGECPIVAAYSGDEPCDVVILAVKMDKEGYLTILAEEKLDRTYTFELDPDNIFAGQLEYVTSEIEVL